LVVASLKTILSATAVSVAHSERLLSGYFGNVVLVCLLLGCVKAGIGATLFTTVIERPVAVESANVASLSFEVLDDLLLASSVFIVCEVALLMLFESSFPLSVVESHSIWLVG
jgi:hypothetical protein